MGVPRGGGESKPVVDRKVVSGFNAVLKEVAREKKTRIERALVIWYVETRFRKKAEKRITDGPDDGGIDAVVFDGQKIHVIQAQISIGGLRDPLRASPLSPSKYIQHDALPDTFGSSNDFETYLGTVAPGLRDLYTRVADRFRTDRDCVIWELVTLHRRSRAGEGRVRNLELTNIRYGPDLFRLYELSTQGGTPPPIPLEFRFSEHIVVDDEDGGLKSYVARAQLSDFVAYIKNDPEFRVLALNVRSELRDSSAREIKAAIQKTYKNRPEEFWYSHNGLTILCDKATPVGKRFTLESPFIINGAQTIHALRGLRTSNPRARVLVRIIEIPPDAPPPTGRATQDFVNDVIYRTNSQNRMYAYDLRANDSVQVDLATEFLLRGVFYERRRGDWDLDSRLFENQGMEVLKSTTLAQILVTTQPENGGVATAKKSKEDLFKDDYPDIFGEGFPTAHFKFRLYDFIVDAIWYIRNRSLSTRERNHALFPTLAVAWAAISQLPISVLHEWVGIIDRFPSRLDAELPTNRVLRKGIQDLFRAEWAMWEQANRRDSTVSPNNFFKAVESNKKLIARLAPSFRVRLRKGIDLALRT